MDDVRKIVLEFSKKPGWSLAKLSRQIGRNPTYLQQFITKGSPERLDEVDRSALALIMSVDEEALGGPRRRGRIPHNARMSGSIALGATVPAYGQAVGGNEGQFILNGNKIADILAPPSLAGVPGAYAVYVVGESMEPRYMPGEAVFVHPKAAIKRGDFVVAQIIGEDEDQPEAYVKRYVSRDHRFVKLEQFNPRKMLEFPLKKVVSIHKIIMGGEG